MNITFEVRYYTGDMSLYKYGETQSRQVEKKWQANHILTIVVFVVTKEMSKNDKCTQVLM